MSDSQVNLLPLRFFKEDFRPHFMEWIFKPINRLVISQDALIGFMFMACVIDYLASFWWGKSTKGHVRQAYIGFIEKYFPPDKYDAEDLYESLRIGLVHLFTIQNKKFALTHNNPHLHLQVDNNNHIILNASNFRDDLLEATHNYFNDVESNSELLGKLMERYARDGFLYKGTSIIPMDE